MGVNNEHWIALYSEWLTSRCVSGPTIEPANRLFADWEAWASSRGEWPSTQHRLTRWLKKVGHRTDVCRVGGNYVRCVLGIKLRTDRSSAATAGQTNPQASPGAPRASSA